MVYKTIKKKTQVCDICEREMGVEARVMSYVCSVCKREICTYCEVSENFQHRAEVCRICAEHPKVSEIMRRYEEKHWELVKHEKSALARVKVNKGKKVTD